MDGHELKEIRKRLGLSQERMASLLNKSSRSLQKWEKDENPISPSQENDIRIIEREYAINTNNSHTNTQTNTNIKGGTQVNNVKGDLNVRDSDNRESLFRERLEQDRLKKEIDLLKEIIKAKDNALDSKDKMISLYEKMLNK